MNKPKEPKYDASAYQIHDLLTEAICKRLRDGNTYRIACLINRIPEEVSMDWRKRGLNGEAPYNAFIRKCTSAEGEAVAERIGVIREKSKDDWRPAAWWLERRCPAEWGKYRSDGFMPASTEAHFDVTTLSDEELAGIIDQSNRKAG